MSVTIRVEYAFSGNPQQHQLSFPAGADIQVDFRSEQNGWIRGAYKNQIGWFPSAFVPRVVVGAPQYMNYQQPQQPQQPQQQQPVAHIVNQEHWQQKFDPLSSSQSQQQEPALNQPASRATESPITDNPCPLCLTSFPFDKLEAHAASCTGQAEKKCPLCQKECSTLKELEFHASLCTGPIEKDIVASQSSIEEKIKRPSQKEQPFVVQNDNHQGMDIHENNDKKKDDGNGDDDKKGSQYKENQIVWYQSNGTKARAKILKIHLDDELVPFYTIQLADKEKQTDDAHLVAISSEEEKAEEATEQLPPALVPNYHVMTKPPTASSFDAFNQLEKNEERAATITPPPPVPPVQQSQEQQATARTQVLNSPTPGLRMAVQQPQVLSSPIQPGPPITVPQHHPSPFGVNQHVPTTSFPQHHVPFQPMTGHPTAQQQYPGGMTNTMHFHQNPTTVTNQQMYHTVQQQPVVAMASNHQFHPHAATGNKNQFPQQPTGMAPAAVPLISNTSNQIHFQQVTSPTLNQQVTAAVPSMHSLHPTQDISNQVGQQHPANGIDPLPSTTAGLQQHDSKVNPPPNRFDVFDHLIDSSDTAKSTNQGNPSLQQAENISGSASKEIDDVTKNVPLDGSQEEAIQRESTLTTNEQQQEQQPELDPAQESTSKESLSVDATVTKNHMESHKEKSKSEETENGNPVLKNELSVMQSPSRRFDAFDDLVNKEGDKGKNEESILSHHNEAIESKKEQRDGVSAIEDPLLGVKNSKTSTMQPEVMLLETSSSSVIPSSPPLENYPQYPPPEIPSETSESDGDFGFEIMGGTSTNIARSLATANNSPWLTEQEAVLVGPADPAMESEIQELDSTGKKMKKNRSVRKKKGKMLKKKKSKRDLQVDETKNEKPPPSMTLQSLPKASSHTDTVVKSTNNSDRDDYKGLKAQIDQKLNELQQAQIEWQASADELATKLRKSTDESEPDDEDDCCFGVMGGTSADKTWNELNGIDQRNETASGKKKSSVKKKKGTKKKRVSNIDGEKIDEDNKATDASAASTRRKAKKSASRRQLTENESETDKPTGSSNDSKSSKTTKNRRKEMEKSSSKRLSRKKLDDGGDIPKSSDDSKGKQKRKSKQMTK